LEQLIVKSSAFEEGKYIPSKYTCDGEDINPPLSFEQVPESLKSLVLIVDDPDASGGTWDHWIVWNIPVTGKIDENSVPGTQGINSSNVQDYGGPCVPSGTHHYYFKVYALDMRLSLGMSSNKRDVERAMQGHVLAQGQLMGLYKRATKKY
jgi:Raf kinase inhibitor-like YbhB/YbcL family protein